MNEEKLNRLMTAYGESLGSCSKTPAPVLPRRRRTVFVVGIASVAASIFAVALWPGDAVAGSLKRIGLAIKNANTMEVSTSVGQLDGTMKPFSRYFYKNGNWRFENRLAMHLELTTVLNDGLALVDYKSLDHATLEKYDPSAGALMGESLKSPMSAIDFAIRSVNSGQVGIKRKMSIGEHAPVDGRPTYTILFERNEDSYQSEIVVDKATDLPISTDTTVDYGNRPQHFHEDYRFNEKLDESLFALRSTKPVIRIVDAQRELLAKWQRPLAETQETQVRDVCWTPDGTIWLAVTTPDGVRPKTLPAEIHTTEGETYARTSDVAPSEFLNKETFAFKGEQVVIVGFVPLNPKAVTPRNANVTFSLRSAYYSNFAEPEVQAVEKEGETVSLPLRRETSDQPFYFTALGLDQFGFETGHMNWSTRAKALEDEGRLLEAAKAYDRTAAEYRIFAAYAGYRPLLSAAKCYRSLEMDAEADRAEAEAKLLEATGHR